MAIACVKEITRRVNAIAGESFHKAQAELRLLFCDD